MTEPTRDPTLPLRFKSAVGRSFFALITVSMLLGPVLVGFDVWKGKMPVSELPRVLAFLTVPAILIAVLYRVTEYVIDDVNLVVRGGIVNATVPLAQIRVVRASHSLMSAPAFSFDRLEISYDRFKTVLISPDDKAAFIAAIEQRCPHVTFEGLEDVRRRP